MTRVIKLFVLCIRHIHIVNVQGWHCRGT